MRRHTEQRSEVRAVLLQRLCRRREPPLLQLPLLEVAPGHVVYLVEHRVDAQRHACIAWCGLAACRGEPVQRHARLRVGVALDDEIKHEFARAQERNEALAVRRRCKLEDIEVRGAACVEADKVGHQLEQICELKRFQCPRSDIKLLETWPT